MTDKTEAREIAEQIRDGFFPSSLSDQASEQIVGATVIMIEVALSAARRDERERCAHHIYNTAPASECHIAHRYAAAIRTLPDAPEGEPT